MFIVKQFHKGELMGYIQVGELFDEEQMFIKKNIHEATEFATIEEAKHIEARLKADALKVVSVLQENGMCDAEASADDYQVQIVRK